MIGIHIGNITDDSIKKLDELHEKHVDIVQIFVNSLSKNIEELAKKFNKKLKEYSMKCVVHISYTINCAKEWTHHSWWLNQFIAEINIAEICGAHYVVVHVGKKLDLTEPEALNNMYMSLIYVHEKTAKSNVKILIETPAGQGTEMLTDVRSFAYFFTKISKHSNKKIQNRFGICVDTCHIFVAGEDIRKSSKYFENFNDAIGLEHIKLIHLNDSKHDCGSKLDRHENIGEGYIGKIILTKLIKFFNKLEIPMVLETPKDNILKDFELVSNIK